MTSLKKPDLFFDFLRKGNVLGPRLDNNEVTGCNADLEACGKANWPVSWVAYAMATDYHETAGTMQPIKEYGGYSYFEHHYGPNGRNPQRAIAHGNTKPGDGAKYCGRGKVQLTWKVNYQKAGNKLGIDLVNNPDRAMELPIAAAIMIRGMEEGWFTGKSLSNYLSRMGEGSFHQFRMARSIINGQDKAQKIANYALHFQKALVLGEWT